MATTSEAFAQAAEHTQAGQFQEAEQICRQILAVEPGHAAALHLLGVIASSVGRHELAAELMSQAIANSPKEAVFHSNLGSVFKDLGKLDEAVACCRRAVELNADYPAGHYNLGNAYVSQGKMTEAIESYSRALVLKPDFAQAHSNLGTALLAQGMLDEAIASCRRALALRPGDIAAHHNMGSALLAHGKLDEAIESFRRTLQLNPNFPGAHVNLGNALQAQGKLDESVAFYQRALQLKPDDPATHNNLGNALQALGQLDEAAASFLRALELSPENVEAHSNLGNTFLAQGKLNEAVASYGRALALAPDFAVVHFNLGTAFQAQGKLDEAMACNRRALELQPDHAEAHNNLGTVLSEQGKSDEAVGAFRRALELKPGFAEAWSNFLFALQYRQGANLAELSVAHAEYDRLRAEGLRSGWRGHENSRDAERRLRVGFVSPDFGMSPVGYFLIRTLENLDRNQCDVICYSDRINKDELTTRLQAAATIWRDVSSLNDERLAESIRADRVDVLFDLAGHAAKNRLLVFARKPAPIQVTWAGYAGTTGLKAIDYILADRFEIPPEAEGHYSERVLRMPDGYVCYEAPSYAPPVSPLPALTQGFVTLGCFNNRVKITSQAIEVWSKILQRVPQSRLVLKYRGMNYDSIAEGLRLEFSRHGIDPRRIECLGRSQHAELLAEYNRIDLALDPFPYSGGLTTCEALWMGVPVITCPGETFASRHSLSHLTNVGLTETIARDLDEYVELAVSLACDLPRLAAMRSGLRGRMAASPLCDGRRFADDLVRILRDIWRQWCENKSGV